MRTDDCITNITLVILVLVRVCKLILHCGLGNRILSQCVREHFSAFATLIVLLVSCESTGCLGLVELCERVNMLGFARSES